MRPGEDVVITQTEYTERKIPVQERPRPVEMPPVDWYVVSPSNADEFMAKITEDYGEPVYMAITPQGYENLAVGINDLRRYANQQNNVIQYYEDQIAGPSEEELEEK
jgi:hypothetical protein